MRIKPAIVMAILAVLTLATTALRGFADVPPPQKPAPKVYDLNKVTCRDLLQASTLDRSSAIMFLWGFEAGRRNVTSFSTLDLEGATQRLMATCEDKPSQPIFAAIAAISKHGK